MQRVFLIILACLALIATGCGDDSGTATSTSPSPTETTAENSPNRKEKAAEAEEAAEKRAAEEAKKSGFPLPEVPEGPPPKKLVIKDLEVGNGPTAKAGDEVSVHYVGRVYKTKELFDANWGKEKPFTFKLGAGEVIKGWDKGVQGMKVGGRRQLIIPPGLAYGEQAIWPSIPSYSTLVFLVDLVGVK
jgi:peptidylprolyl isomerase